MTTQLVTIAIPAYKAKYLKEAIDSVLIQDYNNFELLIVDDCSPYNLKKIVDKYEDSRIKYFRNEKNLGSESIVLNWNKCLDYAQGDFFILLCDDDILEPTFISEMLVLTGKYPYCNTFHARNYNLYPDGKLIESPVWPEHETHEEFLCNRLAKKRHHTITEFLYRTPALKAHKYVVFPSGFFSDNASIIQMSQEGGIVSSNKCLATFRYSEEHITSNVSPKNCWDKYQAAIQYWKWIYRYQIATRYKKQIKEEVESTIYNSFISSPFYLKVIILFYTPNVIISIKQKIGYILNSFTR